MYKYFMAEEEMLILYGGGGITELRHGNEVGKLMQDVLLEGMEAC